MTQPKSDTVAMLEKGAELTERLLNDVNVTVTGSPTSAPDGPNPLPTDDNGVQNFGIVFLAFFLVVLAFLAYRFLKYWQLRRERHLLQVQSNRADAVLGDMQMVPNDEYDDDDPELL